MRYTLGLDAVAQLHRGCVWLVGNNAHPPAIKGHNDDNPKPAIFPSDVLTLPVVIRSSSFPVPKSLVVPISNQCRQMLLSLLGL